MRQYVFTLILTAALTLALAWAIWRLALRFKLYPGIRDRDVHTVPTPRLGGVAMFIAIVTAMLVSSANPFFGIIWADSRVMWSILGAAALTVVVGVLDDLLDLDWMIKLAAQFLAAGIIAVGGGLQIYTLPLGDLWVGSSWLSIALTMFAIVVVMNAVNFIDGLDGLVAGVCLIANTMFFVYSYVLVRDTGNSTYFNLATFLAVVLVGACAGFLPMNWNGAKLFMGDGGALVLGLLMATSAIAITGQFDPAMLEDDRLGRSQLVGAFLPILLPIVVVMLPLLDFGLAIIRRLRAGKSPFSADRKHLHHRMLDMGHSDRDAVLIFYAWTGIFSLAVLLMYLGAREDWPGEYLPGVGFGLLGVAACLVVTLTPSRRTRPGALPTTPDTVKAS
ncbi:MraY family glycosyltransferase [Microbacterium sediminis]|uniref:Undecaprenyl-phosphate alpha-N-acetylglucosaminyl 1-phosphate transferase n=1 Tax=Microbacterium sediminis TaxID=904291 RepID=A0A1B9NCH8_9MICO|nr:MraY family glycosyltransferase [Microbacterium sediminis]OCG74298.1 undecaprenyl-phosphate alpha-N-acetylglucosaminyl 1-phosphate transferase [Microbacterium sediminis]QBR73662.1 undecaprenyl/decaprenyl-phosphate alpha-N-acetylglucosaminyl 1-phosphate transferase [Microbacterium sediminis]